MKSNVVFRLVFAILAIIYIAVLTEFLNPSFFQVKMDMSADVIGLTMLLVGFIFIYLKRSKL